MHKPGWRAPLIASALLGALVSSCGGPPVYIIVPAPPPAAHRDAEAAPAPLEGGLQAPEPVPAEVPPAPVAVPPAPVAAPLAPPSVVRRPGGAPPGLLAPDIPDVGSGLDKTEWAENIKKACSAARYPSGCLGVQYVFYGSDNKRISDPGTYSDCTIKKRTPPGANYVQLGSIIRVEVTCTTLESSVSGASGQQLINNNTTGRPSKTTPSQQAGTSTPGQGPGNNTPTHRQRQSQTTTQDGSG